jgi:hypothetical protein
MRHGLKVMNSIGYYMSCGMVGFLYGKLVSFLCRGIWTEEVKDTKPVLFYGSVIAYYISLMAIAIVYVWIWPAGRLFNLLSGKIDEFADGKEWD